MSIPIYDIENISPEEIRRRAAVVTLERFRTVEDAAMLPAKVIRPIEDQCRSCTQRPPHGNSPYCANCIEIRARIDANQNRFAPRPLYWLLFGALAFLLFWLLSGWMDMPLAKNRKPEINAQRSGN